MTRPSNQQLSERVELGAFVAIVLYGVVYGIGEVLSARASSPYLIAPALMVAYVAVLYAVIAKADMRPFCGLRAPLPMPWVAAVCMALLAVVPCEQLLVAVAGGVSIDVDVRRFLLLMVGAIVEEVFFRGFLITWLTKRWGMAVGASVLVGAVLFALLHCANALSMPVSELMLLLPFALFAGVAFGFLRVKSDSIAWCIALHALINASSFAPISFSLQLVQVGFAVLSAIGLAVVVLRSKEPPSAS